MDQSALAIVEINFQKQIMEEEDIHAIEALLRSDKGANNLSLHGNKMTFFVWRKDKVDFRLLDQIKEMLHAKGKTDFTISAGGYLKTDHHYHYTEKAEEAPAFA